MTTTQTNKTWFRIKKDVEYSTDFKFFVEHQLRIIKIGKIHSFCSRLEPKEFSEKIAINKNGTLDDVDMTLESRKIHQEILAGKHGKGKFVN